MSDSQEAHDVGNIYQAPAWEPEKTPSAVAMGDVPKVKPANYWLLLTLSLLGIGLAVSSTLFGPKEEELAAGAPPTMASVLLSLGFLVTLICQVVLVFKYLHRSWRLVDPEVARTTPGKAIGFLFIPFFNLYWVFQTWYGLSVDFNRSAEMRQHDVKLPKALFLTNAILCLICAIPLVNFFAFYPALIVNLITWWHLCKAINFYARP